MNNKVSVIMPLFNGAKTINETVKSLFDQTFSNWELIIVDDCSKDNSYEIACIIAGHNPNKIKVFKTALNGGPMFKFSEAISFQVFCDNQEEIDHYWDKLTEGGEEVQCGWLKDKYGLSWQIVPSILPSLMTDPAKAGKVTNAYMKMKKFDIAKLLE